MKVSKVVLIVVALHVLVIGGIFIFEGCSRAKTSTSDVVDSGIAPGDESAANATALPAEIPSAQTLAPAQSVAAQPAAASAKTYVVKKGDSLWKIAKSQSVSIGDLARANSLNKTTALKVGQKLQIPAIAKTETVTAQASVVPTSADASAPATTSATPMEGNIYIVKTGDSLWKIARAQNISVATIKQANSLTGDSLKIGQKLHLPTATAAVEKTAPAQAGIATSNYNEWQPGPVTENGQQFHIVDIGESPAIIAKKYGIKTEDLMKANGISDAKRIMVGQKLTIPIQTTAAPVAATTPAAAAPIVSAKQ